LLLSLSSKTERPSEVTSESQESKVDPESADYNKEKAEASANEDAGKTQESGEKSMGLPSASEKRASKSSVPRYAGFAGKEDQEVRASVAKGEQKAAQVPFRKKHDATHGEAESSQQTGHHKYLLVDDNDINLKILASFMKRLGHGYDTASNGLEALQMYSSNPGLYQFILMGKSSWPSIEGRRLADHLY
jgi:PleD family two-component response regulator